MNGAIPYAPRPGSGSMDFTSEMVRRAAKAAGWREILDTL
jgi:hypothetical protein